MSTAQIGSTLPALVGRRAAARVLGELIQTRVTFRSQGFTARTRCPLGIASWSRGESNRRAFTSSSARYSASGEQGREGKHDAISRAILDEALLHVPQHGWTTQAIVMGVKAQGLSPSAHGIFPRGPIELVEHFQEKCHIEWVDDLAKMPREGLSVTAVIGEALAMRLLMNRDVISQWPQAIAMQALPSNASSAITTLARTCDTACNLGGPAPIDAAWFGKRITLGAIYMSAELYMLTDYSEDFADTRDFFQRQVDDAEKAGTPFAFALKHMEGMMASALESLQSHKDRNRP